MLTHIHIKDLAIVSSLELDLNSGMTTLTGETGAGKSILIDALGLVLGDRVDNEMIRDGCERAEITAMLDLSNLDQATDWLQQHSLDAGDECILRRVLSRSGNSKAYINGSPVPAKSLQTLGDLLVDIHGQHAHHSLLKRNQQRELLDDYAGHQKLRQQLAEAFQLWQASQEKLQQLSSASSERREKLELLRYQVSELNELKLAESELLELDQEHSRLSNAGQLQTGCDFILSNLYDDENAIQGRLSRIQSELEQMITTDPSLSEIREMLDGAVIQVQEATHSLRHYAGGIELDPARLELVEQRLADIHDMARKYRCRPEELPATRIALEAELEQLKHADIHLAELEQLVESQRAAYMELANKLDSSRRKAGEGLARDVSNSMNTLGMPDGLLKIDIETLAPERASANGLNRIEFLVSANPGQPPKPLIKVASGGELSRISLAIQVATVRCSGTPVLIFDEVDVGIGGGTAEIVGNLLRQLGEYRQVLCVTHLPQVAAQGHNHLQVTKSGENGTVQTRVVPLDGDLRIQEVARMLGGVKITDQTLAHAEEMVGNSQS
ncbi:MAG: DNA repair protein RecN [Gammaproteobacteria bacterium]|nr:DNA repair protein RecN [Gammaproteobacteria bacterium]